MATVLRQIWERSKLFGVHIRESAALEGWHEVWGKPHILLYDSIKDSAGLCRLGVATCALSAHACAVDYNPLLPPTLLNVQLSMRHPLPIRPSLCAHGVYPP